MDKKESILVIEDDELFRETIVKVLEKEGYQVKGVKRGEEALDTAKKESFNLVIADVRLPGGMDGIDILERLMREYNYPSKMIIMTGYADAEAPVRAIKIGVDDYIFKPFSLDEFMHSVKKSIRTFHLEKDVDFYRELSIHDGLTNLYNHRYFHEIIEREINRADRYGHSLSLFMVDIDNFKRFNDSYGHMIGDVALRKIADLFKETLRKVDLLFRYGGEEFSVLLPETDAEGAFIVGERMRAAIESVSLDFDGSNIEHLTISIGIATLPADTKNKEELINFSDKALYQAKQEGKNKISKWQGNISSG
ncbi:MAG: diguanylate cyclase [Candidatus Omnitrophota bacterium]